MSSNPLLQLPYVFARQPNSSNNHLSNQTYSMHWLKKLIQDTLCPTQSQMDSKDGIPFLSSNPSKTTLFNSRARPLPFITATPAPGAQMTSEPVLTNVNSGYSNLSSLSRRIASRVVKLRESAQVSFNTLWLITLFLSLSLSIYSFTLSTASNYLQVAIIVGLLTFFLARLFWNRTSATAIDCGLTSEERISNILIEYTASQTACSKTSVASLASHKARMAVVFETLKLHHSQQQMKELLLTSATLREANEFLGSARKKVEKDWKELIQEAQQLAEDSKRELQTSQKRLALECSGSHELKAKICTMEEGMDSLLSIKAGLESQVQDLQSQVIATSNELRSCQSHLITLQEENSHLTLEIHNQAERIDELSVVPSAKTRVNKPNWSSDTDSESESGSEDLSYYAGNTLSHEVQSLKRDLEDERRRGLEKKIRLQSKLHQTLEKAEGERDESKRTISKKVSEIRDLERANRVAAMKAKTQEAKIEKLRSQLQRSRGLSSIDIKANKAKGNSDIRLNRVKSSLSSINTSSSSLASSSASALLGSSTSFASSTLCSSLDTTTSSDPVKIKTTSSPAPTSSTPMKLTWAQRAETLGSTKTNRSIEVEKVVVNKSDEDQTEASFPNLDDDEESMLMDIDLATLTCSLIED